MLETTRLRLDIQRQPDDVTCGPTCLHAVYRYYGDGISLNQVIQSAPRRTAMDHQRASPSATAKRARPAGRKWFVVAVVLLLSFAPLGLRDLWEPDEGRYVAVAMEMLRSGDWP